MNILTVLMLACDCDPTGSTLEMCEGDTGICLCKPGYGGGMCDRCDVGFFGYPYCIGKYFIGYK